MNKYSVIVPVYNRPNEVDELLSSLTEQTFKDFNILIVEDGSSEDCQEVIQKYSDQLNIEYFYKENTGPGDSRNFGMQKATGEYLVFFDSDCIIPKDYFKHAEAELSKRPLDCFGGPDSADSSFTTVQKAINYAMTSIVTTGGIRGKQNKLDTYQPRSFNMGIKKTVFEDIGGFSDIHPGEDPDFSYRIMNKGYTVGLIEDAFVYHKRRTDFQKFVKQVYKFGVVRVILIKWHPDKFKPTYLLPTLFLLGCVIMTLLSAIASPYFALPLALVTAIIIIESLIKTKSLLVCLLSVLASYIQLLGYGYGFLLSAIKIMVLKKDEREAFPSFFFSKP